MVVCPNPRCQRQITDPVLLTIHSITPPIQYDACPYCLAKIEPKPQIEQKDPPEPTIEQTAAPEHTIEQEDTLETKEPEEPEKTEKETVDDKSGNNVLENVKDSRPSFLKKVKALIPGSNGLKKETAPKTEPKIELNTKKTELKNVPFTSKEDLTNGCPETFGYLANRPKDVPIPQVCLVCPKMVDCMLSPRDD